MADPMINDPKDTAPPPSPVTTDDDRMLAMVAHLLGIVSFFIGALVVWLVKKDQSAFIDDQAKEALNFQITMLLLYVVAILFFCVPFIGWLPLAGVWVLDIVFCILGGLAANRGEMYRYPIAIRLVQ